MADGLNIGKNIAEGLLIFIVVFFLSAQIQGMSLEPNVSKGYIEFYGYLALESMITSIAIIVFRIKMGEIFDLSMKTKMAIFGVWLLFIIMISVSAGQILPVPRASVADFQLSKSTELYTSSVIPGVLEDWRYLFVLPTIIIVAIILGLEYGLGVEVDGLMFMGIVVLACFVAALGYNLWVIPGFTSSHVSAYGQCQNCYIGAFMFGFGQSMIYMFTNTFIPVAHILHNALVTYSQLYQINIGPMSVIGG
jgi:hypothetical protein